MVVCAWRTGAGAGAIQRLGRSSGSIGVDPGGFSPAKGMVGEVNRMRGTGGFRT